MAENKYKTIKTCHIDELRKLAKDNVELPFYFSRIHI
jgi:hypothetical protein